MAKLGNRGRYTKGPKLASKRKGLPNLYAVCESYSCGNKRKENAKKQDFFCPDCGYALVWHRLDRKVTEPVEIEST